MPSIGRFEAIGMHLKTQNRSVKSVYLVAVVFSAERERESEGCSSKSSHFVYTLVSTQINQNMNTFVVLRGEDSG